MEYHEAVNRLECLRRLRPKLGTETTASLLAFLGNPHEGLPCVQIAGSNGKGSTARFLESILAETGLDVGLYTSPDLNGLRERIRVGQRPIPRDAVRRFVERTDPYVRNRSVAGETPTYFEVLTALALWQFAREDVDVAVLEVGIGGRYDATSVVEPRAAAVTSISLEHTDIIGSTVEEIAADKASVAPDGAPLVTGATGRALSTIRDATDVVTVGSGTSTPNAEPATAPEAPDARNPRPDGDGGAVEAAEVVATETGMASRTESAISIRGRGWAVQTESPLLGEHQAVNAGIAATLARQVADPLDRDIAAGIRNVHWPGRFEVMGTDPLVVLDGAHNPAACETVTRLLDRFDVDAVHLVFGAMRDKDHGAMSRSLPALDRVYVAESTADRAQDAATLAAVFEGNSEAAVTPCQSVAAALDRALDASGPSDCVLVTGSLSVVAEARDRWTRHPAVVRTDDPQRARSVLERADVPAATRSDVIDSLGPRTVRFHARRGLATALRTRMLALGGTGAVSGIEATDRHVRTVLSGTTDQFADLVRWLRSGAGDRPHLGGQLEAALARYEGRRDAGSADGTAVMGVLNVTPDSFHDGGEYEATADAVERAREMVGAGAAIVDVGGESTRPGADPVTVDEELDRVIPVVERLADLDATVSVDTRKPAVASAAIDAGAGMVNDVTGLADARMRRVVADRGVSAVLMHSVSAPVDPDDRLAADDVVRDVVESLTERILLAERAGIDRSQLLVDPGLGFGKSASQSFALLDRLDELHALGTRVMVGHSHKSMFAEVTGEAGDRFAPTVAATALAAERGADVVRVHDVAPNAAAIETARRTEHGD